MIGNKPSKTPCDICGTSKAYTVYVPEKLLGTLCIDCFYKHNSIADENYIEIETPFLGYVVSL